MTTPPDPPPLSYYRAPVPPLSGRIRLLFFLLTLPAAVCPWFPFASQISPWDVVKEVSLHLDQLPTATSFFYNLVFLAAPFFVGLLISAWHFLRLFRRATPFWLC